MPLRGVDLMNTVCRFARVLLPSLLAIAVLGHFSVSAKAADTKPDEKATEKPAAKDAKSEAAAEDSSSSSSTKSGSSSSSEAAPAKKPKFPPYADVFRDADDPITGLIKMRRK